ncbi:MAG TPA: prepilin-type N-terminal cleavage/methylation domain-containing protein [Terracidiphilus sp.]|nr:prepilin-type N-terminal cleavage/methylation domain-containing protein [Terracidiphilus sp.]
MNCTLPLPACRRSHRDRPRPNGFTLMELLIVIAIILILMLMAIPTFGTLKKRANDLSAINSIQKINQAEIQYESTYPANGYTCTLSALGGDPSSGPPSPTSAQILQGDITSGYKSGYVFTIGNCTKITTTSGTDRITGYNVTAVPQTVGKTGDRSFCSDQNGTIKYDPTGGTNCTQSLQ